MCNQKILKNFNKAAKSYDKYAFLQREVAQRLSEQIPEKNFHKILDLGCGTGNLADILNQKFPLAQIYGYDLAIKMLEVAKSKYYQTCQANAESLPLDINDFDLVVSNLMLQWTNPKKVFEQTWEVLKPNGKVCFATFTYPTLTFIQDIWLDLTKRDAHQFLEQIELVNLLSGSGFTKTSSCFETLSIDYQSAHDLLIDLKSIGAFSAKPAKGLVGKNTWRKFTKALDDYLQKNQASYQVAYIYGEKLQKNSQTISISQ